jgi:membrane protein
VTLVGLFAMYMLVPNHRVSWRHAAVGALLSALLFAFAKWAFTAYVSNVPSYRQIYGQLAVVPIFLIWIYLSWAIVLLGASIAASLSAFEYRPRDWTLPAGGEFLGLMHLLKHLVRMQQQGRGMSGEALLHCERFMTDDLLQRYLIDLQREKLIRRTEEDLWMVVRNLDNVTLACLYEAGHYRLPLERDALDALVGDLPQPLVRVFTDLAADLHTDLDRPLGELFLAGDPAAPDVGQPRSMSA